MSSSDYGRSSSDSDNDSGGGGGGGGGSRGRASTGGGRGRGRQRNGKLWLVKECPTSITGTIPLSFSEGSEGADGEQNSDFPPILPLVGGRVYLEPELDSKERFVLELDDSYEFLYDGAFDPARWFHDHLHQNNIKEFYPSYKELPKKLIQQWFDDFKVKYCCPSQSDGVFSEAFEHMVSVRYKDIVAKMKKAWFDRKIRPTCFEEPIWNKWLAWWNDAKFRKISRRNKENRKKVVAVATGGSVSAGRQIRRMKKVYGPHIDEVDAYTAMHTRKGQRGELEWASDKSEKVLEQYKEIVHEKAVSEGVIDSEDNRNTRLPFKGNAWVDAVDAVAQSEGKETKKGKYIFGFGDRRKSFLQQPRHTRPSLLSGTGSSTHDPEKEKMRDELSNLKDAFNQMKDTQDKMMQFFMGGGGGCTSFYPQQRPSWGPNMSFIPTPSNVFPPSGGMFPPQMHHPMQSQQQLYQSHYQQQYPPQFQPQQQQIQSGHSSASPGSNGNNMRPFLEMLTDPNFVLPDVGGHGGGTGYGAGVTSNGGGGGGVTGSGGGSVGI